MIDVVMCECVMSLVPLQPDAPADPHALPHEVPVQPLQALTLPAIREAKDGPPAAGVHAGCPPHALWVSRTGIIYDH